MTSLYSSLSSELVAIHPMMYGGRQDDYLERSEVAIREASEMLRDGACFSEIHGHFSIARRNIAIRHKTRDEEQFGESRIPGKRTKIVRQSCTPLDGPYEKYNSICIARMSDIVEGMRDRDEFIYRAKDKSLGRTCMYEVKMVKPDVRDDGMRQLSVEYPVKKSQDVQKSIVIGTIYLKKDGIYREMTRYYTWINDELEDPVCEMRAHSKVLLLHHHPKMIRETLDDLSGMFAHAISWHKDSESLDVLKDRVSLFRFTYAHCMPAFRGDGAIGDWFELLIYRYHGFAGTYFQGGKLSNFEPMISTSLSAYREAYNDVIVVSESI